MTRKDAMSRRDFLGATVAGAAAPLILPRHVLGAPGKPGANDRIVTGHIGVGGMGFGHLKSGMHERCGVICDVDQEHIDRALKAMDRKVDTYTDFRRVLERKDIDAVLIAAPDHWHAIMTVMACEAGKDVYCEKPACKTVEEGRKMIQAARRYSRVVQVGAQGRSTAGARQTCAYVRNGNIGKVNRVECWHVDNYLGGDPTLFQDPPEHIDWEMWLGPSPWRPYNPDYVHFNFRWMMDWGQGFIRDRGAHLFSVIQWCLDLDQTYPNRITARATKPQRQGLWDVPVGLDVTYEYNDPELVIHWNQPGTAATPYDFGCVFHGDRDSLVMEGGDGHCVAAPEAAEYTPPADGFQPFESPGHVQNWLDCIKTRERPNMDIELGVRVVNICNMANVSYQLGRTLEWDGKSERVIGDEEANRFLSQPGRGQWQL